MAVASVTGSPFSLAPAERARLLRHVELAAKRARHRGGSPVLAGISVRVDAGVDPSGTVVASRRGDEPWFVMEQPDRGGSVVAALGCAVAIDADGPDRFRTVARRWRTLLAAAAVDPPAGPRGSGPVAVGGFAFADQGGASPHWRGFAPGSMHVPELSLARRGDEVWMSLTALIAGADNPDARVADLAARADELVSRPLPMLDPDPVGGHEVVGAMPPEHYVGAVARAVERIRAGKLAKIVLAREVQVHASQAHQAGGVLGILRDAFPSCFVFCVGRGERTFIAASPELLIRRDGLRAGTLALAGSTRRSADPAVDDHLGEQLLQSTKDRGEQQIVTARILRALRPHSVWVTGAEEPEVVRMANIQHLATPIRAQLAAPVPVVELAGLLHPTPAVGGEPHAVALPMIPELEGLDRGWYAGPVGWTDANEDGEFCVALRSALLDGPVARCYAGVGVVADSDPAAELAETEIKLQALLPVLAL
ncbi:Salicylate biosynthesis isochorismate synthase [Paraconexibacter sp. AEG42_29]|uniref:isochorismate synthase n=1 Tax=Paraconexibacter sp. AEG42_29 TaxID=2997339 RepID=A0AAU7AVL4_9ACTN